jgi:hypothetical protein
MTDRGLNMRVFGDAFYFCSSYLNALSQHGKGTLNPAPLLPFWEKGLGDEGHEFAKVGCTL